MRNFIIKIFLPKCYAPTYIPCVLFSSKIAKLHRVGKLKIATRVQIVEDKNIVPISTELSEHFSTQADL